MINSEYSNQSRIDAYKELAKNSLVRVQYSCCGNENGIDEEEYIPIVTKKDNSQVIENEDKTKNA